MNKLIAAAAFAATAALAPAFAQAQTAAEPGVYANLGYAYTSSKGLDVGGVQAKLGYRFHPNFGVEGEGAIGVDADREVVVGTIVRSKLKHQLAAYVIGFVPISDTVDLFARVGYGTTKLRVLSPAGSASDSEGSLNIGAGGQVHFDGKNGLRLEYLHSDFKGQTASTYAISYSRRF